MIPALVIAGTQSGVGKTSITLGICRALARRGVRVQPAKVGPDYLDPIHLTRAAGCACWNLDPWMMGEDYVRRRAAEASADLLLIEGVMGLYDGADAANDDGSTAQVARLLDAPVWLVADAHGAARSFAAMVHGFASFPGAPRITGVIANRCGSPRHQAILREALASANLPPLLGAIAKGGLPALGSRHLGLVDDELPLATLDALADAVERQLELPTCAATPGAPPMAAPPATCSLAVAWDAACGFAYADLWEALAARGVVIRRFSPIADAAIPEADGLYLPGGYPELHAERLSANQPMLAGLRAFCASGKPVYAECGGLMLLSSGIGLRDGRRLPMAGVLPAWTRMLPRRSALGYAEATLRADACLGRAGSVLRGHEFHYSELESAPTGWDPAYTVASHRGVPACAGWRSGAILASYLHLHLASRPDSIAAFARSFGAPC